MKTEYPFTEQGIKDFQDNRIDLIMQLLEKCEDLPSIHIVIGDSFIEVPIHADSFDLLMQFLLEAEKDQY